MSYDKEYQKAYYLKNKVKKLKYHKLWASKNKKKLLAYKKEYREENLYILRAKARAYNRKEVVLKRKREWSKENRDKCSEMYRKWDAKTKAINRHKKQAQGSLQRAVKRGIIIRKPCEICGIKKVHGHHEDYSKPLKVRWLCVKHHRREHKKYL